MQIDWSTLGLQAVNAVVLIWLLAHFLFRPVVDAIAARQKAAGQLLADAKAAKTAAEGERDKAAAETARLAEHRSEALKAAEAPGGNPGIARRGWRVGPFDGCPCGHPGGGGGLSQSARRCPRTSGFTRGHRRARVDSS